MQGWISHPDQVDAQVARWRQEHPSTFTAESITQFSGRPVWALTITDKCVPAEGKRKVIFDKPHAHEPAPIAGQMGAIAMLLTGESLDGRPSEFDNDRVLEQCLLTFLVDCNPGGTARAPVEVWDGSYCDNATFLTWAFGLDRQTAAMWKRVDLWDDRTEENLPERIGIAYEQISEHEYAEPNRCHRSSLFQWLFRLWERGSWDLMLSLHQTEFDNSDRNCMALLQPNFDELPTPIQARARRWGDRVVSAWNALEGARPIQQVKPLDYTGPQREYLVRAWREFSSRVPMLTSEIQNNNSATPPLLQMRLNEVAIRATVEELLT
jgi:hypothetical protein